MTNLAFLNFAVCGLLCAYFYSSAKSGMVLRALPTRVLALAYGLFALQSGLLLLQLLSVEWPWVHFGKVRAVGAMLLGPLLFAFVHIVVTGRLDRWLLLHGLPAVLMPWLFNSPLQGGIDILIMVSSGSYCVFGAFRLLKPHDSNYLGPYAKHARRYLIALVVLLGINVVIELGIAWEWRTNQSLHNSQFLYWGTLGFVSVNVFTVYLALLRSPLLQWLAMWDDSRQGAAASQSDPQLGVNQVVEQLATETQSVSLFIEEPLSEEDQNTIQGTLQQEKIEQEQELAELYKRWQAKLTEEQLFCTEESMTVTRAAKRLGVPVRKLSMAVNSLYGASFSQMMNDYRVKKAQALLQSDHQKNISEIMLESGFSTKSNFHKEFTRLTAMSPSEYRKQQRIDTVA